MEPSAKKGIQCAKCPWKKSTNPREIPNDYSEEKHAALRSTIARPGSFGSGPAMACHESEQGNEAPCVGWVIHQLNEGNNLGLRLKALDGRYKHFRTIGEQHTRFEDTLPKGRKVKR